LQIEIKDAGLYLEDSKVILWIPIYFTRQLFPKKEVR
jgi:hypothetical protein